MGLNSYAVLNKINVITGTEDDPSVLTSRTSKTQDYPSTLTSRTGDSKISSNVTTDKGYRNNLVASSPLQKSNPLKQNF